MSFAIGTVNFLVGQVVAVAADGTQRVLKLGDVVLSDEVIQPAAGAQIEISLLNGESIVVAGGESWSAVEVLSADSLEQLSSLAAATSDTEVAGAASDDVTALQEAILAGVDPTQVQEATAAGGAPAAGGPASEGGSTFVALDNTGGEVLPQAGYDTTGLGFTVQTPETEEPLLQPAAATIPLTEPEPEPENAPPTISVQVGDDTVFEAGLESGSGIGDTATTLFGSFTIADPDGLSETATVTINGTVIPLADLAAITPQNPLVVDGAKGSLTITGYADGVAQFFYTLATPVDDSSEPTTEQFSLVTSDGELDSEPVALVINISDDAPLANNDANTLTEEGGTVTGNVFGTLNASAGDNADIPGADTASVTGIRTGDEASTGVEGSLGTALSGSYGTLILGADGQYSYELTADLNALDTNESRTDVFTYTLTDADGESDTAELVVTITGTNDAPILVVDTGNPDNANDTVYEAGLAAGSHTPPTTTVVSGTFTVADPDGLDDLASVTIENQTFTVQQLLDATALQPLTVAGAQGTLSIIGYADGIATYSYTLTSPVDDNEPGAVTQDSFILSVSDGDLESAPVQMTVDIVDDQPLLSVMNLIAPTAQGQESITYTGFWSGQTGADQLVDFAPVVEQPPSITVNGMPASVTSYTELAAEALGTDDLVGYNGTFSYNDGADTANFTLLMKNDGTYTLTLTGTPEVISIDPTDFQSAVAAQGPTATYIVTYQDQDTGEVQTATVTAAPEGQEHLLTNSSGASVTAKTVGSDINASGDGIGIENNIIQSYYDKKTGEYTTERLTYAPDGVAASSVLLDFKESGDPGFGSSAPDLLYVSVLGSLGTPVHLMLDSTQGDFLLVDGNWQAITPAGEADVYTGGPLSDYTLSAAGLLPEGELIDSVDVMAGFPAVGESVDTSSIKIAFGFGYETVSEVSLPVQLDFEASITDADGDSVSSSFSVLTDADTEFDGADLEGADAIYGTEGDDSISAGLGDDILQGEGGADSFAWDSETADGGIDRITDFDPSEGDALNLSDLLNPDGNTVIDASNLDQYLAVSFDGDANQTTIDVYNGDAQLGGDILQTIVILGDYSDPTDLLNVVDFDAQGS